MSFPTQHENNHANIHALFCIAFAKDMSRPRLLEDDAWVDIASFVPEEKCLRSACLYGKRLTAAPPCTGPGFPLEQYVVPYIYRRARPGGCPFPWCMVGTCCYQLREGAIEEAYDRDDIEAVRIMAAGITESHLHMVYRPNNGLVQVRVDHIQTIQMWNTLIDSLAIDPLTFMLYIIPRGRLRLERLLLAMRTLLLTGRVQDVFFSDIVFSASFVAIGERMTDQALGNALLTFLDVPGVHNDLQEAAHVGSDFQIRWPLTYALLTAHGQDN